MRLYRRIALFLATVLFPLPLLACGDDTDMDIVLGGSFLAVYAVVLVFVLVYFLRRARAVQKRVPWLGLSVASIVWIGLFGVTIVPALYRLVQYSHEKETMANMRLIGTRVEDYAEAHKTYPTAASIEDLERVLGQPIPLRDGWGHSYRYAARANAYVIVSQGKDGEAESQNPWSYTQALTKSFDADVVFSNGAFVRALEGSQC
jgi:type II secretory pathway pseudopilin PulG